MDNVFTSFTFGEAAIKNGFPARLLRNGANYRFLMKHCTNNGYRSKTWNKIIVKKAENVPVKKEFENTEINIAEAIKILKNAGYKILKPVDKFEEI